MRRFLIKNIISSKNFNPSHAFFLILKIKNVEIPEIFYFNLLKLSA